MRIDIVYYDEDDVHGVFEVVEYPSAAGAVKALLGKLRPSELCYIAEKITKLVVSRLAHKEN